MSSEPSQRRSSGVPEHFAGGRYVVLRALGEGGQKTVYVVRDTSLERECALALVHAESMSVDDVRRLRQEAKTLARMGPHPRVVTVFDLGEEDGRAYLVCEYVPGGDLATLLREADGALPIERALAITRGALEGLAFVHKHGIVHRDLKPANLWLDARGEVKLGDFGLAHTSGRSHVTAVGDITGTPAYIAPEQLSGLEPDGRADLYALGCVLYEMLTGRPPFTGPPVAVISQHLNATPSPPGRYAPELSGAVDRFVLSLLARSPDARPGSAEAALSALDGVVAASSTRVEEAPRAEVSAAPEVKTVPEVKAAPEVKALDATAPRSHKTLPGRFALALCLCVVVGLVVMKARTHLTASAPGVVATQPVRTDGHRLAVLATREGGDAVDGALAWALSSRLIEEVDRYREFRPVSPAGLVAARATVLGDLNTVPDEARVMELARRVDADTVAALSVAGASNDEFTVAVHVFSTSDPTRGATGMRQRLRRSDLDGDGATRLAGAMLRVLARHWSVARWTDEQPDASPRSMPFDAWRAFLDAEESCLRGAYNRCEAQAREGLTHDPDSAILHIELACALSYQGRSDESLVEQRRVIALRGHLRSRRDLLVVDQGVLWIDAELAHQRGERAVVRSLGRRIVALDLELARGYGDPLGLLYAAAATQYFMEDVPGARAFYAEARGLAPMFYPAWYEDAILMLGDGTNESGRREAARLFWTFAVCYPDSEQAVKARDDAAQRHLERPAGELRCPASGVIAAHRRDPRGVDPAAP